MTMVQGGDRRDRKPFEPPPWEREAFERMQRERSAEREQEPTPGTSGGVAEARIAEAGRQEPEAERDAETVPRQEGTLPREFDMWLEGLRGEEAVAHASNDTVGAWISVIVGVFGCVLFVWGAYAVTRGGGLLGFALALVLMSVGGVFGGAGAWLAVKRLKRQGVL